MESLKDWLRDVLKENVRLPLVCYCLMLVVAFFLSWDFQGWPLVGNTLMQLQERVPNRYQWAPMCLVFAVFFGIACQLWINRVYGEE